MSNELGTLILVPSIDIWKHETAFSRWLTQEHNLQILGDAIGVNMVCENTDVNMDDWHAEILANDEDRNHTIIIENQFGTTDSEHLGKILTCASQKNAKILVWIAEEFAEEHRTTVGWLNKNLYDTIAIFLVKVTVYRIGDSLPAPQFSVIQAPTSWTQTPPHWNNKLDTGMIHEGIIVSGYHVEAGSRKFDTYAKAMINDLGDNIRPYLKSFYKAVRDFPGMEGIAKSMDTDADVDRMDVSKIQ